MNEIIGSLSIALVHFLWQGCLIVGALALALRLSRDAGPRLRYALSVGALGLLALAPVVTLGSSLMGRDQGPERTVVAPGERPTAVALEIDSQDGSIAAGAPDPATRPVASPFSLRSGIVALWFVGVLVFTGINTGGWLEIRSLRRSGVPVADPAWDPWVTRLRARLGIRRRVSVLVSDRVDVPTVIGWIRPVVLIPTSALLGMSAPALEALLLHELAHIRRHDFAVNLLQAAVETLLFYHPAVWWVSRRVRHERELCCDDMAVSRCGNRLEYIQALVKMERLRSAGPNLALAADGGSLVERIRRLTGTEEQRNGGGTRGAFGIWVLVLTVTIGAMQLLSAPSTVAAPAPQSADQADARSATSELIEGRWRAETRRGRVWMELRVDRDGKGRHTNGFTIDASDFTGTGSDGIPGFRLVRDAGTFHFEGSLQRRDQDGRFEFRSNPEYASRMAAIGFEVSTTVRRLFEMAALDVSVAFAEGIRDAGYGEISTSRLVEFRIHGVTPEFIAAIEETGFDGLAPSRLVEFRIHGVTPEFIDEMAEIGLDDLSESRLVEFRIHGVTPEFVDEMEQIGFDDLSESRLVEFRIHGVTPSFVREIERAGVDDLSPSRMVEFRIHGVTPGFIEEMHEVGFRDVSANQLVAMRIHGVSPEFARKAQAKYGDDVTVNDLIDMRIHGRSYSDY